MAKQPPVNVITFIKMNIVMQHKAAFFIDVWKSNVVIKRINLFIILLLFFVLLIFLMPLASSDFLSVQSFAIWDKKPYFKIQRVSLLL